MSINLLSKIIAVLGLLFLGIPQISLASEIITGQAVVENGNISKAREDARKDAMRTIVENRLGVKVDSNSVVVDNMLVRDIVTAKSEGYILVKKVLREWQSGNVFSIEMEVDVDSKKIQVLPAELKGRLEAIGDNTSRSGIQVAIIGTDEGGRLVDVSNLSRYFSAKLRQEGLKIVVNDEVMNYLAGSRVSGSYNDKIRINNEVRRIARQNQTEDNAIVRGELSTVQIEYLPNVGYKAVVLASFEVIGLESSTVDPFVEYVTAVGSSREEAVRKANDLAAGRAAEALGKLILETVQAEFQGGVKTIKTTVQFGNITDRAGKEKLITGALESLGCRIIRYSFTKNGYYRFFIETSTFSNIGDLQREISKSLPVQMSNDAEDDLGSKKITFEFL